MMDDQTEAEAVKVEQSVNDAALENVKLRKALVAIRARVTDPQCDYDKNGAQWTGKNGHEYVDQSYLLEFADEIFETANCALTGTGERQ